MSKKRYSLDDLPQFSPWPARLLGLTPFPQKHRTEQENLREYDREKWARLRKRLEESESNAGLSDVIRWELEGVSETLCHNGKEFELLGPLDSFARYLNLVEGALRDLLPAAALIELGAGYGRVLLSLAESPYFRGLPLIACDASKQGLHLLEHLAARQNHPVTTVLSDITRLDTQLFPPNALVLTSFALMYLPQLQEDFFDKILALKPKAVVHFEPCYEHCDKSSLWGLLLQRYMELNDYNRNLISLLRSYQTQNKLRIIHESSHVFGNHPLISVSLVVWTPR